MAEENTNEIRIEIKADSSGIKEAQRELKGFTETLEDADQGMKRSSSTAKILAQRMKSILNESRKTDFVDKFTDTRTDRSDWRKRMSKFEAAWSRTEDFTYEDPAKKLADAAAKSEADAAKRTEAFRNALQRLASAASSAGRAIRSKLTERIKEFGKKLTEPIRKAQEFFSSIKRIAMYRAIRTAMKEIAQGFSEGVRNLYEWSSLGEGHFKSVMDSMASSFLYLKNSIGAAVAPLLGAFANALDVIVDKAVAVINVLNQLFARLTGQSFWYKAKKVATQYADAANGAAKATRNQLMAFDELNNITTSDGGGGGSSAVGEDWFSKEALEDDARSIAQRINDFVDGFDSEGLGKRLGAKINEIFTKIDTFLVDVNWKQIGWKISDFIVNAVKTTDFSLVGKTLADKLNVSIDIFSGLMSRMSEVGEDGKTGWQTFGKKIGDLINGWVQNIHWKDLGEAINNLATGLAEMISEAFRTIKWEDVKQGIEDFFEGLGWEGALLLCAPLVASGLVKMLVAGVKLMLAGKALGLGGAAAAGEAAAGGGIGAALLGAGKAIGLTIVAGFLTEGVLESGKSAFVALAKVLGGDFDGAKQELAKLKTSKNPIVRFLDWSTTKISDWISGNKKDVKDGLEDTSSEIEPIIAGVESDWDQFYKNMDDKSDKIGKAMGSIGERARETRSANALATAGITTDWDNATTDFLNSSASWLDSLGETQQGVKDTASSLGEIKSAVNELPTQKTVNVDVKTSGLDTANNKLKDMLKYLKEIGVKSTIHLSASGNVHGGTSGNFASGGFPTQGTYFLAGEMRGEAEMVGTINGRTGVASGQEITGIAEAVYSTSQSEMQAMQEQNNLLRALLGKELTISPSAALGRINAQSAAMYARVTGA